MREPPRYVCIYEDPLEPEAPAKIVYPAPQWLDEAMQGGILPPVQAIWAQRLRLEFSDGPPIECGYHEAQDIRAVRGRAITSERLLDDPARRAEPLPAMTEEEAMEWLVLKDVPRRVWDDRLHNRPLMALCRVEQVPSDRRLRAFWRLADVA